MNDETKVPEEGKEPEQPPEQQPEEGKEPEQPEPQPQRKVKQKYLRNKKTGVVFAYSRRMAGLKHMEVLDKKPNTEKPSPAMRKATFPLSRKDREAAEKKRLERDRKRRAEDEERKHESETLSDADQLRALGERAKKIKSKKDVIGFALEELGVQVDLQDANGNDRNIMDLKREVIEIINSRLKD